MKDLKDYYKEQFSLLANVSKSASVLYQAVVDLAKINHEINVAVQNEDLDNETLIDLSKTLCKAMELSTKLAGELIVDKLVNETTTNNL